MRKVLVSLTPFVLTLAACAQSSTTKPATSAQTAATGSSSSPSTGGPAGKSAAEQQPPPPAHPLTDAQARELMQLTGVDKMKEQLLRYFQHATPPYVPKEVQDDLSASLEKADVNGQVAGIYKKYLSTEDAEKAIAFYKTSAGQDLVKTTPMIMSEAQHTAMQTGQATARTVMERHKAELEAAQKEYQKEHAPKQQPTLGAPGAGSGAGPKSPSSAPGTGAPTTAPKSTTPPSQ